MRLSASRSYACKPIFTRSHLRDIADARGLANRLTELGEAPDAPAIPDYPITYDAGKALHSPAKAKGNSDYAAQWAGQAASLARQLPAAELVSQLKAELKEAIARLNAMQDGLA